MKRGSRNRLLSAFLLMLMVMNVGIRCVHIHHYDHHAQTECADCQHHKVHSGHLSAWDGEQSDCFICHVLATPYVKAECTACNFADTECQFACFFYSPDVTENSVPNITLRGPPSFLL